MTMQLNKIEEAIDQRLVRARKENMRRLGQIEHRLEYVDTVEEVEYINDAKAQDINSSWYSIDCMEKPVIWIISSCSYKEDYSLFNEIDCTKLKALVVLGPNQSAIEDMFRGKVKTIARAQHLENAIRMSASFVSKGDVVLYSPAFSDMENYTHYKERGQQFRKAVREFQLK